MRLSSKKMLIKYIKEQLGAPLINIEVSDSQISQIIDDTVQKFTEYAYGTLEDVVILKLDGDKEYKLPNTITNIIKISKGRSNNITNFSTAFGENFVPEIWSKQFFTDSFIGSVIPTIISISNLQSTLDKYFGDDMHFNFNPYKKTFKLFENYVGYVALHYQYEYIANENNDYIYNQEWIKEYSTAKTKFLWGSIVGKYDQNLVGAARINYDSIKSEAQEEINRLNDELLTKWSDPAPVLIG